jgi:hypothetical protein
MLGGGIESDKSGSLNPENCRMAVLRAAGIDFDVDRFCSATRLSICKVFNRGESRLKSRDSDRHRSLQSGINIPVCETNFDDLEQQITDAIAFFTANEHQIRALCEFPGVEGVSLDFGIKRRDVYVQTDVFPSELVRIAGSLGLEIELTQYPISGDGDNGEPSNVSSD